MARRAGWKRMALAGLGFCMAACADDAGPPGDPLRYGAAAPPGPEQWPELSLPPSPARAVTVAGRGRLLLGDSATQAPLQNAAFDLEAWLDDLQAHGIGSAMVWAFMAVPQTRDGRVLDRRYGYLVPDLTPWPRARGGPPAADGGPRWDLTAFDEEGYWPRLRTLLDGTARRDMALWITVFDGWAKEAGKTPMHPFRVENGGPLARGEDFVMLDSPDVEILDETPQPGWSWQRRNQWLQERFAGRLASEVARYRHVILELFNEGEWYDRAALRAHQEHFLQFFRHRLAGPLAVNADVLPDWDVWADPRIDVVSFHTRGFDPVRIRGRWLAGLAHTPAKPLVNSETVPPFPTGYGETVTEAEVRRLLWTTVVSGGHVLVQDDSAFAFDPRAPDPGGASLRRQIGLAARFLEEIGHDPARAAPAPDQAEPGYAMAAPGRLLVYLPTGGATVVRLDPGAWSGLWLDPAAGRRQAVTVNAGGAPARLSPPGPDDWVLFLRRADQAGD